MLQYLIKSFKKSSLKKEGGKTKLKSQAKNGLLILSTMILITFVFIDGTLQKGQKEEKLFQDLMAKKTSDLEKSTDHRSKKIYHDLESYEKSQKKSSLKKKRYKKRRKKVKPRSSQRLVTILKNSVQIPPGSILRARVLMNASDGPIRVKSTQDLVIQSKAIVPAGSIFYGIASTQKSRLMTSFSHLTLPSNKQFGIKAIGLDFRDKSLGIRGTRLGARTLKAMGIFGLNMITQTGKALTDKKFIGNAETGEVHIAPTLGNSVLFGVSKAGEDTLKNYARELKNTREQVLVKKGKKILIMFQGSMSEIEN